MERIQKAESEPANRQRVVQGQSIGAAQGGVFANRINGSPEMAAQRQRLGGLFGDTIQRAEEEILQGEFEVTPTVQLTEGEPKPNKTGLPDNLKNGIESLSGMSMDSVRVHYNSSQPAQLNAHAYAQGTEIHVAPGKEHHLPHEAWHVVQQAEGRVRPTMQMKGGAQANDDKSLEHEADVMGDMAMTIHGDARDQTQAERARSPVPSKSLGVAQRVTMREIMTEQARREASLDEPIEGDLPTHPPYTTVGFEWDIAKGAAATTHGVNPLQGLTHVTLAKSDYSLNGLHYYLETDADDVIEFITPPYYVKVIDDKLTPERKDLVELIDASKIAIKDYVKTGTTLQEVLAKAWEQFAIKKWHSDEALTINWSNWTHRAHDNLQGLKESMTSWKTKVMIGKALDNPPQINMARTPSAAHEIISMGKTRLDKEAGQQDYEKQLNIFKTWYVKGAIPNGTREESQARLDVVLNHMARVTVQSTTADAIKRLAEEQKKGAEGSSAYNEKAFIDATHVPSYVKDRHGAWIKTDLWTFAERALHPTDWPTFKTTMQNMIKKMAGNKDNQHAQWTEYVRAFAKKVDQLTPSTGSEKGDAVNASMQKLQGEERGRMHSTRVGFNEHDPLMFGVRQDTYISPKVTFDLATRLRSKKGVVVIEVRNTSGYLESGELNRQPSVANHAKKDETSPTEILDKGTILHYMELATTLDAPWELKVHLGEVLEDLKTAEAYHVLNAYLKDESKPEGTRRVRSLVLQYLMAGKTPAEIYAADEIIKC